MLLWPTADVNDAVGFVIWLHTVGCTGQVYS